MVSDTDQILKINIIEISYIPFLAGPRPISSAGMHNFLQNRYSIRYNASMIDKLLQNDREVKINLL